jgi:uncharacterized protein YybS (DUF2232 family)
MALDMDTSTFNNTYNNSPAAIVIFGVLAAVLICWIAIWLIRKPRWQDYEETETPVKSFFELLGGWFGGILDNRYWWG